jgi:hypothetical protein
VEIIPIVAPQVPDQETARTLAEQIADNLEYRHITENRGLTPPAALLEQLREAVWMQGEDDPSVVEETARLHNFEQDAEQLGWTRVTEPRVTDQVGDAVLYDAKGITVVAAPGIVGANTTGPVTCDPETARAFGAALIVAAKQAEDRQQAEVEKAAARAKTQ